MERSSCHSVSSVSEFGDGACEASSVYVDLDDDALRSQVSELAANINLAQYHLLLLIAEMDRRAAWAESGLLSMAHWLNWRCGISLGPAREKVRVARCLESLPLICSHFASGELSYSKVRAMTRIAAPDNERQLVNIALHGTAAQVEKVVRACKAAERLDDNGLAQATQEARSLRWYYDDDGMLVLKARLPAEEGAALLQALRLAEASLPEGTPVEKEHAQDISAATSMSIEQATPKPALPIEQRRADALATMASSFLESETGTASQANRFQVVLHTTESSLADAESRDTPDVPAATLRRIACDAAIVRMGQSKTCCDADDESPGMDIGRRTRVVPASMRRALQVRDGGCRFPGCTHTHYVDAHHIRHWANGGETKLSNLVLLCRRHHRLVHEGGFSLECRDDGVLLFFAPSGALIEKSPALLNPSTEPDNLAAHLGGDVSAETLIGRPVGGPMDLGLAVDIVRQGSSGFLNPPP